MRPMLGIRIVVVAAVVAATTLMSVGVACGARERGAVVTAEGRIPDPELLGAQRGGGRQHRHGRGHGAHQEPDRLREREAHDRVDDHHRDDHAGEAGEDRRRQVTEAVSKITWTATGGGLEPGQFDLFTISAGPLPTKPSKLEFKAVQTYSDGTVVRWIQPTVKGAPEPDHPAPTLTLTKATSEHGH